jgi:bifunctional non-homologous end joining protein LigD
MITRSRPPIKAGSAQPLADYQRKRDFNKTTEPPAKHARSHRQLIFVIQEHHARHLHYDLRLEADGVLKSWAVTKVPTMDPAVRRLAIRTEDHPLEYANFRGDIPEGQYGAGHVEIWDRGTYENLSRWPLPKALAQGKIEIDLHGQKLKGKFALIRIARERNRENWLLVKMNDDFAVDKKPARSEPLTPENSHTSRSKGTTSFRPGSSTDP